jgi:hypothetical protein
MDNFEKWIIDRKGEMDLRNPPIEVWQRIESKINQKRWSVFRIAAAIGFLVLLSGLGGYYLATFQQKAFEQKLMALNPEFRETEEYLVSQFQVKFNQIIGNEELEFVKADLNQLDLEIEDLKKELIDAPFLIQQNIISNLIRAYQLKLELLDLIIQQSYQYKNHENYNEL